VVSGGDILRTQTPTVSTTAGADFVQTLPRADRNALGFVSIMSGLMVVPGATVEFGPPTDALYRPAPAPQVLARSAGGAAGGGRGGGGAGGGARSAGPPPPVFRSAQISVPTNVRWRILPSGSVERSTNGGGAWTGVALEPGLVITQGAAPSATVCWLIGRSGVVLLSTEGTTFRRVPFPVTDVEGLLITASDAENATVNLADGRVLTTSDGGQSWRGPGLL
jgi:hypothetical protein